VAVGPAPGLVVPRSPAASASPDLSLVTADGELPVQRLADLPDAGPLAVSSAAGWGQGAEAATAPLAPVARAVRPVAQTVPYPAPELFAPAPIAMPPVAVSRMAEGVAPAPQPGPPGLIAAEVPVDIPVQRAAESTGAASGGAGGHSEKELDDLARHLYDRLRSRLRQELLVDRERAGLITDLR
jgi:hypothetical protein